MSTSVFCSTRFVAFHYWPDADELEFSHLKTAHRHEFQVKVGVLVTHDNRHIEFQKLKKEVNAIIEDLYGDCDDWDTPTDHSCEMMAKAIAKKIIYPVTFIEVSEDGENGAVVTYE